MPLTRSFAALGLCLALALAPSPAWADAALPKGVAAGPSIEGIDEYVLPNGLRVLLFPDASKPTVTVNITYGVGSAKENYGETGMAHLLEHLVFKGTPNHADITGELKKRGINFNGTTYFDRTNYYSSFPANDDTLRWVLGMEADRMVNSFIAKTALDSEMTVVRNEMERGENSPMGILRERVRATAYLWHNYGHSTIGARSDVENVPIERLQAFYHRWYQPDTATLIVAGRIDPAATLQQINATFGKVPRPARALPPMYTVEPTQDGERAVDVRRTGDVRLVMAAWHMPALAHPDSPALDVLANLLTDVPSGRLHKALVETKLAAGAGAGDDSLRDPGLFSAIAVIPRDGDPARVETTLLEQVENIAARPVTEKEVDEAKQRLANAYDLYLTDVNAVGLGLSEFVAAGDWRLLFITRDAIAGVTAADVNRVAAAYLKPSNRTLGRFIPTEKPDRAEIPATPDIAALAAAYKGKAAVAAGETFDPTPQNIQARTLAFTLGNGLKVSLLPKKTRGETVVVDANFHFGDEKSLESVQPAAPGIAGAMLTMGSQSLSREQISQRFDALKTQARISGSLQGAGIALTTRRDQLADALALAADVLRHPAFPDSEFEQLRLQMATSIEASRKEPGTVAGMALSAYFDPWPAGHPLHLRSLDQSLADLKALKLEQVKAFHHDFYGSADGEIAIVGDFDPDAVKAQLESLFPGWVSPKPYAPIATHYAAVAARAERFETPDKANAVLLARANLPLKVTDADYPALVVANRVFGGGALKSRLGDRIRQKEGLSYGIGSSLRADDSRSGADDAGSLVIQAIAAPENMARVETGVREELARLVRDGIGADELKDAVEGILVERQQARASDGNVADVLTDNDFYGRTMQFSADRDAQFKALSLQQVNDAIRRAFKPDTLSVFSAGDFAKAAGKAAAQ